MEFEKKILSREIQQFLYGSGLTVGSAESCTGGRIAESIIAVPGASTYFKGGVISYTNEVKENLLSVDHNLLEEKTAVCEEVAKEMVKGAIKALNVDFAIASTDKAHLPTPSLEIARATPFYSVTGIFGATPSSFAFGIFSFR